MGRATYVRGSKASCSVSARGCMCNAMPPFEYPNGGCAFLGLIRGAEPDRRGSKLELVAL